MTKNHPARYVGASNEERPDGDFYPTPPGATLALLDHMEIPGPGRIWEPACGDGAISKVLTSRGYGVASSDVTNRGYNDFTIDFFDCFFPPEGVTNIITNPPYRIKRDGVTYPVERWIEHAWAMPEITWMALFMKTTCLAGKERSRILERCNLDRPLQFRQRVTLRKNGIEPEDGNTGMIDFAWFIFDRLYEGPPRIFWVEEVPVPRLVQGVLL
jgi:hypothetical protein